jgi:nucleoside-diphosphate-sugar epimerase
VRDYVHVADLAAAHLASLKRLEQGGPSGFFNLGNGDGQSVRQVIDTVGRVAGRPVPTALAVEDPAIPPGWSLPADAPAPSLDGRPDLQTSRPLSERRGSGIRGRQTGIVTVTE